MSFNKTGKWDCVSKVDSNQFANCPYQMSNDFHWEIDHNPAAYRHDSYWDNVQRPERIPSILRDFDVDTTDDFYVAKEYIRSNLLKSSTPNYTKWSSVLLAVIKLEQRRNRRKQNRMYNRSIQPNRLPEDVQRNKKNGKFRNRRSSARNRQTNKRRIR